MIGHGAAAHRNAAGGAQPHKCFVFYGAGRQTGHVPCRGIVTLLIQTVGICKGGTGHAQLRRLAVHLRHEALQTAAVVRQSQCRIVAGAQQQTVQKLLHRHPVAGLQIHGGALRYVLLGHCDHIPQTAQVIQKIRTPDKKSFAPRSLKDYLVLFLTLVLVLVSLFFAFHLYKGSGLYQHRQVAKADRLIEEGQFEKAKEVYRSLANNPPEDLSSRQEKLDSLIHSQFHYEMGLKAMDQEDPFSALTYFNKVLPEDLVRYNKAHQYIGNLEHQILKQSKDLLQEGQVDEAVDLLHRLLDILPKSAEGLNLLDNILNEENISPDQRDRLNEIKDLEKIQEEKYKPKTPEEEKRGHLTKKAEDLLHSYQTVVEDQANLRESPSLDAKILHHLPKNSSVYIYETSIEKTDRIWCKVQIQTPEGAMYEGWVSSRILGDQ